MKFPYKKLAPGIVRPIIPIELSYRASSPIAYEVLIDSGADVCIFDSQIGELLEIDILKGDKQEVQGITGLGQPYYVHKVTISVGGWKYTIAAGFIENLQPGSYGIVGQNGFFDKFVVKFNRKKEEVELTPLGN